MLEIAQDSPIFGPAFCAVLDFDVVDYRFASTDSQAVGPFTQLDNYPDASVELIGDQGTHPDDERYDLVVLHCEFDTLTTGQRALAYARACLKPDGRLLLRSIYPAQ